MSDIKPLRPCAGVERFKEHQNYARYREDKQLPVYISPDVLKEFGTKVDDKIYLPVEFNCKWPTCNCKLSEISGAFHREKFSWIAKETIKDPKFKHEIRL